MPDALKNPMCAAHKYIPVNIQSPRPLPLVTISLKRMYTLRDDNESVPR